MTPADANHIEGFLCAIARLKDDGTSFQCIYLGEGEPSGMAVMIEEKFQFRSRVTLVSERESLTAQNLPKSLERWFLDRIRPMDDLTVDSRLVSGLADELADIYQKAPVWFSVKSGDTGATPRLGVLWSIYVFGLASGSCAVHCSWDD
ncbi:hypothetical protein GY14_30850 [Delftia tsuruhatensis]|uniref:hypothetical protein n=1 Tax=uncultured Delftia sp. TaxID=191464 RepID=UPI0004D9DCEF|nr:hypothetical protein [uncultured Delftia sp.]KEH07011.1 hypothetical protein GY14_30850 [Delftia tsuruhatensis]